MTITMVILQMNQVRISNFASNLFKDEENIGSSEYATISAS